MTAHRIAALALAAAAMTATFALAVPMKAGLQSRADAAVASAVNQAFDALAIVVAPAPELIATLTQARADALPTARTDRGFQTVTVEQRLGTAVSVLVRLPVTELAQR